MKRGRKGDYWDARLERWGAWRVGAGQSGAPKVATWAGMRSSSNSLANWAAGDEGVPRLYLEEVETHAFITYLAHQRNTQELAAFALTAYPNSSRLAARLGLKQGTVTERRKRLIAVCRRLLDQRKRGEPLSIERRARTPKAVTVRATVKGYRKPQAIASASPDG